MKKLLLFNLLFLFALLSSCANTSTSGGEKKNPFEEEERIIRVGPLEVNEAQIYISLGNDKNYKLHIPVKLDSGSPPIKTTVYAEVADLSGEEHSEMHRNFGEIIISNMSRELVLDLGKDYLPELEDAATMIMGYGLEWDKYVLEGKVSLFRIMPRIKAQVLGSSSILQGDKTTYRILLTNVLSGDPIMNAPVTITLLKDDEAVTEISGNTDRFGMASIEVDLDKEITGNLSFLVAAETSYGTKSVETQVLAEKISRILLTTDKPVYQPGQTIHIRSLSLQLPHKNPIAEHEVTLEITDPKGNKVFKKTGLTSKYGIFAHDFTLADLVNIGKYTVSVIVEDIVSEEKTITVEHYTLPKFAIDFESDKNFYTPSQTVKATVEANYFYGKPVSGGTIHIVAKTFDVSENTFQTINGVLDKNGRYHFEVKLPSYFTGSALDQGKASAKFEITVIDGANSLQSIVKNLTVVKHPVFITLVPKAGKVLPGISQEMFLILTDPAGQPVKGKCSIITDEDSFEINVDESGLSEFTMELNPEMPVTVKLSHEEGKIEEQFFFKKDGSKEFIFLTTESSIYQTGDSLGIEIYTGFDPSVDRPSMLPDRAYIDIIQNGQVRLLKAVNLKEGSGSEKISLDETFNGPIEIIAYYLTREGNIIRSSKVVYVRRNSSLNIDFSTDKKEYRPREQAVATFKVTDMDGSPAEAALGVAMVDEAVFHVMSFNPGMEQTYFDIENEVMESTYIIYGIAPGDITSGGSGNISDEEIDKRAEAFFADNGSDISHGVNIDNYTESKNKYLNSGRPYVIAIARKAFEDFLAENNGNCNDIGLDDDVIQEILNKPENADPWDNIMKGVIKDVSTYHATAIVTSAGPDEIAGTESDISVTVTVCEERWGSEVGDDEVDFGNTGNTGDMEDVGDTGDTGTGGSKIKVREWFPETLYFNPELITGKDGIATVDLTMPDSITTWRVTTLANSMSGDLGSSLDGIRVFQDFFVDINFPVFLTQNDEVSVPVGIYNYLSQSQTVELVADSEDWFEMTGPSTISVTVPPNSVSSVYFPVKVKKIGRHTLTVFAYGSEMSDAVKRSVTVLPDGIMEDQTVSRLLDSDQDIKLTIPDNAIPDSAEMFVRIYPGIMSQAVEGLDSMLRMPTGCFEQTSSATYPNVLVLQYMIAGGTITPEVELRARDFITQGYQRLLTFESPGGGFDWFGNEPANIFLTSYGLMQFVDMSKVHEVDPALITRTASWIAAQQNPDGSFTNLRTTAYGAWALNRAGKEESARSNALSYLESNAGQAQDIYTKAITAISILSNGGSSSIVKSIVDDILSLQSVSESGGVYWRQTQSTETYSSGIGADIETTALVGLLLLKKGGYNDIIGQILAWIVEQKDSFGTWSTTQGTVLALRFLIGSLDNETTEANATIKVSANGSPETTIVVTPADSDVLRLIDLKEYIIYGENDISIEFSGEGSMMYQAVARWYVPGEESTYSGPLTINVTYDKTDLQVNDIVGVTVEISNISSSGVSMVLASVGLPPGFSLIPDKLIEAVEDGTYLQRYETTPRQIILYIDHIAAGETMTLNYDMIADFPIEGSSGESSVNPYYNPENKYVEKAKTISVRE